MEFEIRIYKNNGSRVGKLVRLSKELYTDINSGEVVINYKDLSFRAPCLDDLKTNKIVSATRSFFFNDKDDRLPENAYKVDKVGDDYFISDKPLVIEPKIKVSKHNPNDRFDRERCVICSKLIKVDEESNKSLNIGPHHTRCLTKLKYKQ